MDLYLCLACLQTKLSRSGHLQRTKKELEQALTEQIPNER